MMDPLVTVLMPVYDAAPYVGEAIESILSQSFSNFEFIIINDGSTDASQEIIDSYQDERIRSIKHAENQKIVSTLNQGISLAKGRYIARMDADDIADPDRLQKQVTLLEAFPEVGVCGSWIQTFGAMEKVWKYPLSHEELAASFITGETSMFGHPSVMMRISLFSQAGFEYSDKYLHSEDYHLWNQLKKITRLTNIPEVLLYYRLHSSNVSQAQSSKQRGNRLNIRLAEFEDLLDRRLSETEEDFIANNVEKHQFELFRAFILEVDQANAEYLLYDVNSVRCDLRRLWEAAFIKSIRPHPAFFLNYLRSPLKPWKSLTWRDVFYLMVRKWRR